MSAPTLTAQVAAAQKAAERAAKAQEQAAEAQAAADRARAEVQAATDARMRAHAERTLETFDADATAAQQAITGARQTFERVAVASPSLPEIRDAYLAWHAATHASYLLYRRLANALARLERQHWKGNAIPTASQRQQPPPFSEALSDAIGREVETRNHDAEDAYHDELRRLQAGEV